MIFQRKKMKIMKLKNKELIVGAGMASCAIGKYLLPKQMVILVSTGIACLLLPLLFCRKYKWPRIMIWLIVMALLIAISVIVLELGVVSKDIGVSVLFSLLLGEFLGAGILTWNQYRGISYKSFGIVFILILMELIAKL